MTSLTKPRLTPIPLTRLAVFFVAGIICLLLLITSLFVANIKRLEQGFVENKQKYARQELKEALVLMERNMRDIAKAVATWDETKQQLDDPAYYAYWRNSRILSSGLLPTSMDGIELYNVNGLTLSSESRVGKAQLPTQIKPESAQLSLVNEDGKKHFVLFFPIFSDLAQEHQIGFGGLKLDFNVELKKLRRFLYIDMQSVQLNLEAGQSLPFAQALGHITFDTQPNAEVAALKSLIYNVMYQVGAIVLLGILCGYFFVVLFVAKPLRRLSQHIDAMRAGRSSFLPIAHHSLVPVAELENVRVSLNDYQCKLDDMHVNLENKNEQLWTLAHHDPLTGIHNRRAFEEDWNALTTPGVTEINIAFLLFDCDHFKAINDTYGHQVGDQVIQGIAQSLHGAVRTGDRLYRMGGDEFATILHETDVALASRVAERCIEAVNAFDFSVYGLQEPVRISIGIAHSRDLASAEMLHKHADIAMYHAKRPGNAKVAVYTDTLAPFGQAMLSSPETAAVYAAMTNPDLIEMHYQKIVQLPSVEVEYFEALVRIHHADSLLYPGSIFSVVEAKRLEIEFDRAVLDKVRMDLAAGLIPAGTGISINVSGMSIVTQQITDQLLALREYLDRYKLVIEVTETSLITQISHASANLNQLRKAGFVIALDDFGSGYSSFRYLSTMPVDVIKFDISMVRCLEGEDRQRVIVENLAKMIGAAGFKLVAEGIETQEMLDSVTALGFTHAQGYFMGRPESLQRKH